MARDVGSKPMDVSINQSGIGVKPTAEQAKAAVSTEIAKGISNLTDASLDLFSTENVSTTNEGVAETKTADTAQRTGLEKQQTRTDQKKADSNLKTDHEATAKAKGDFSELLAGKSTTKGQENSRTDTRSTEAKRQEGLQHAEESPIPQKSKTEDNAYAKAMSKLGSENFLPEGFKKAFTQTLQSGGKGLYIETQKTPDNVDLGEKLAETEKTEPEAGSPQSQKAASARGKDKTTDSSKANLDDKLALQEGGEGEDGEVKEGTTQKADQSSKTMAAFGNKELKSLKGKQQKDDESPTKSAEELTDAHVATFSGGADPSAKAAGMSMVARMMESGTRTVMSARGKPISWDGNHFQGTELPPPEENLKEGAKQVVVGGGDRDMGQLGKGLKMVSIDGKTWFLADPKQRADFNKMLETHPRGEQIGKIVKNFDESSSQTTLAYARVLGEPAGRA